MSYVVAGPTVRARWVLSMCWLVLAAGWAPAAVAGPNEDLYWAARNGDVTAVQEALDKGANPNSVVNQVAILFIACWMYGNRETVQALLDRGANVNTRDATGTTALIATLQGYHFAAPNISNPNLSIAPVGIVQALLDGGADVNLRNDRGETPLIAASAHYQGGYREIVQALLDKGADVNAMDADGTTALMKASSAGNLDVVRALLDKGAEVNAMDADGTTALMMASPTNNPDARHREVVQALLANGAVAGRPFISYFYPLLTSPLRLFLVFSLPLLLAWRIWSALHVRSWASRFGIYVILLVISFGISLILPYWRISLFVLLMAIWGIFGGRVQM
jgi:ankyrin repeat protein